MGSVKTGSRPRGADRVIRFNAEQQKLENAPTFWPPFGSFGPPLAHGERSSRLG